MSNPTTTAGNVAHNASYNATVSNDGAYNTTAGTTPGGDTYDTTNMIHNPKVYDKTVEKMIAKTVEDFAYTRFISKKTLPSQYGSTFVSARMEPFTSAERNVLRDDLDSGRNLAMIGRQFEVDLQ